ncbi:MAG: hypothetical protein PHW60_09180 [Kiritimatiellae bacterium]|nr:hypothetical protein [Kiritimatiellia bacterium]
MIKYKSRITSHGNRQLELQVVYPLSRSEKRKRYEIDLYMFNPYQLGITLDRYGTTSFLRDMRSYTRYEAASISLAKLADPACELSPLTRIFDMLKDASMARDISEKTMLHELRGLSSMYHNQLGETCQMLMAMLESGPHTEDVLESLMPLLHDADIFLTRFRSLRPLFMDPRLHADSRLALDWADESISLTTEKTFMRLCELFLQTPGMAAAAAAVRERLEREQQHRQDRHYPTVADAASPTANEYYLYRDGQLKKWMEAFMFMTCDPANTLTRVAQVFMGVAAGAAMAFAVLVTFFASRLFADYSLPWAIMIIVAYIVKDRIKDIMRNAMIACLPKLVADQINDLIDPANNAKVGTTRARVRFCGPDAVPEVVRQLRSLQGNPFTAMIPPENVIHFHKDVYIDSARFMSSHRRLEALADIMRFKLDTWLDNMDDPVSILHRLNGNAIEDVPAQRVYHINLIVGLSELGHDASPTYFRYRLILTREGIVRIDEIKI